MELRRSKRVRDSDLALALEESLKQFQEDEKRRKDELKHELKNALSAASPGQSEIKVFKRRKRNKRSSDKEVEKDEVQSTKHIEQKTRNYEEPEPEKTSPEEESEPMDAEKEAASSRQAEHEARNSDEPENERAKSEGGTDQALSERNTECGPEDKSAESISDEHAAGDEQDEAKSVLIPKLSKRRKASSSRYRASTRKKKRKKDIVRKHFGFAEPVKPKDLADAEEKCAEEAVYCLVEDDCCQSLEEEIKEQRDGIKFAYPSCDDPDAVEVHQSDIQCLKDNEYINDTVIDLYIKFLKQSKLVPTEQVHIFNSFFFKKLATAVSDERGIDSVDLLDKLRKWIKGGSIFEKRYLVVPVHDRLHWSLAIICFSESKPGCHILHLDSMKTGHRSQIVYEVLRRYLLAEWRSRGSVKVSSKDIRVRKVKVPQQENGYDCGLFMLHFIEKFLSKAPPSFSEDVFQNMFDWFSSLEASELRTSIRDILQGFLDEKKNEHICKEEDQDDVAQDSTGNKAEETNEGQDANPSGTPQLNSTVSTREEM